MNNRHRSTPLLRSTLTALAAISALGLATQARAEGPPVSIQFSIGTPPPVYAPQPVYVQPGYPPPYVVAPPSMVWLPSLGAYIALGLQQPIFYLGGVYYYNYGGGWYRGPHYGGPWNRLPGPPPQLRRFHGRDWGRYQKQARQYGRDPHWRHFRAANGPQQRPHAQGPQHRPGNGPGPGNRPGYGPGHRPDRGPQHGPNRGPQHGGPGHGPQHGHQQGHGPGGN
jgi:hypothetical protein